MKYVAEMLADALYARLRARFGDARQLRKLVRSAFAIPAFVARERATLQARGFARTVNGTESGPAQAESNRLRDFFDSREVGPAIFKWHHYFEIYDRHLSKFVDQGATLLEIGILGGGSLDMWEHYLGADARIYGVDIDPECKRFERDRVTVFTGDQGDRDFWRDFRSKTPYFDVIIDDGGHTSAQQRTTLEELLPRLRPGGVYVCEDVHGEGNVFLGYVYGLIRELFAFNQSFSEDAQRAITSRATGAQSVVHSIHLYPYVLVIEKVTDGRTEFVASRKGTVAGVGGSGYRDASGGQPSRAAARRAVI